MNQSQQWHCFKDKVKMEETSLPMTYRGLGPMDIPGVKCPKCENEQILFSNAVNKVTCNVCETELAVPSSGKAVIKGEIVAIFE